ncbi:hypothetical protein Rcae01_00007 [Novipirellula caenicola]|uniref:Uncharacterized protein n=1 Tax=Novipirellula caenicola TaxID=1536901 RepID=A0ABP9VH82_9BACT
MFNHAKSRISSTEPKCSVDELIAKVEAEVVNASRHMQAAMRSDPAGAGRHLSEGLYYIDRDPLRVFSPLTSMR